MRVLILLLMLLLPGLSQAQPGDDLFAPRGATQTDFLPVEKAFRFTWERLDDGQVQLRWQIAPGYYLYQKRLRFDGLDPALQPQLPPGESHSDEFFGESQVYRQSLELTLPAAAAGQLRLGWQGCADAGLCYPPQSQALDLGGTGPAAAGTSGEVAEDQGLAGSLRPATWPGACCCSSASACCWRSLPVRCRCCRSSPGWWSAAAPALVAACCWPVATC